jgi:hypothetical protein
MKLTDGQRKGIILVAFGLEPNTNAIDGMMEKKLIEFYEPANRHVLSEMGQRYFKRELKKMHGMGIDTVIGSQHGSWFPFDNWAPKDAFT